MTGDGKPDVVAIKKSDGTLWLYPGTGNGYLSTPNSYELGGGWGSTNDLIGIGDFDSDGKNDLLARRTDGNMWFYPGTGTGWLDSDRAYVIGGGWGTYRLAP
jgi:hypothetical protein